MPEPKCSAPFPLHHGVYELIITQIQIHLYAFVGNEGTAFDIEHLKNDTLTEQVAYRYFLLYGTDQMKNKKKKK